MISARGLSKVFEDSTKNKIYAIKDINLEIQDGEFIGVFGHPGAGKTTLIGMLSGLHTPTTGVVEYDNMNISTLRGQSFTKFRQENIGVIFRQFYLAPMLTVYENIEMAANLVKASKEYIHEMIEKVDLVGKEDKYPDQLSHDEQQRVAVARALIKRPRVLFCDEPTGSLDEEAGHGILNLINELTSQVIVFVATHKQDDPVLCSLADRVMTMRNGMIDTDR